MRLTATLLAAALELGICTLAQAAVEADPVTGPVASKGCATADLKFPATPGGPSKALKFGDRIVRVTLPKNYVHGTPTPLILAFHDQNSTATEMEAISLLSREERNPNTIVVYPQAGVEDRWQSHWDPPKKINDLQFTTDLLDRLSSRLCVDLDRIYATGLGTGGGMVHLMSCNSPLSARIAAFSLVNPLLLQGFAIGTDKLQVKDAASLLWHNCKPKRKPIRLLEIHGENNTLCNYWGEKIINKRRLLPIVKYLVDWSMRDDCGKTIEMPLRWRNTEDPVHKTSLERGYIFEGMIENATVIKASYHCWPGAEVDEEKELSDWLKKLPSGLSDLFDETPGSGKLDSEKVDKQKLALQEWAKIAGREISDENKDTKESKAGEAPEMDEDERLRHTLLIEHYFIKDFGHGWPRIQKQAPVKEGDSSKPVASQPWLSVEPDFKIPSNYDSPSTFHYGFDDPTPSRLPAFDATDRVLDFFRMYKLSDKVVSAPENEADETSPQFKQIDEIIEAFKEQVDSNSKAVAGREDAEMAKIVAESDEKSTEGKSKNKDEL